MKKFSAFPFARMYSLWLLLLSVASFVVTGVSCARQPTRSSDEPMQAKHLPTPDPKASPLLQLLQKRHTSREYAAKPIDRQMLSNLLWAAYGVNRPDGKRTAPSAHDWQYIDIYVSDESGVHKFDAKSHDIVLVKSGDIRALTGMATAPINLVYVCDDPKMGPGTSGELKTLYAAATTGAIVQNVYLFSAENDLNSGVRADIDRAALASAMGLGKDQTILLAQSVGYPPKLALIKSALKSLLARH